MTSATAMHIPQSVTHLSFPQPINKEYHSYRGNYLARELGLICNDTKGLFPKSAKRRASYYDKQDRPRRYLSEYLNKYGNDAVHSGPGEVHSGPAEVHYGTAARMNTAYKDPLERYRLREEVTLHKRPNTEPIVMPSMRRKKSLTAFERGTIARKGHIYYPSNWQMFSNWRVPDAVYKEQKHSPRREKKKADVTCPSPRKRDIPHEGYMPIPSPPKDETRKFYQKLPVVSPAPDKNQELTGETSANRADEDAVKQRAEKLMRNANSNERRAIEKIYKAGQRGEFNPDSHLKTQESANKKVLHKWLDGATDQERQAAMEFFGVLKKGSGSGDQAEVEHVLKMLENMNMQSMHKGKRSQGKPGETKTKHIRINTPGTRARRFELVTWHHMPPIKDDNKVDNKASHYMKAGFPVESSYTIHPDWG